MNIETRNLGPSDTRALDQEALRALSPALHCFEDHIRLVRVRFVGGVAGDVTCRLRVWCGRGPTVVIEKHAASSNEAVHAAADCLSNSLRRRWSGCRARQRRDGPAFKRRSRRELS